MFRSSAPTRHRMANCAPPGFRTRRVAFFESNLSLPLFFESWPAAIDFYILAGILRLGQKYQIDPLRKHALVHLSERTPPPSISSAAPNNGNPFHPF
ncbi:hypothetical protein K438DRAFT_1834886 [Mycena galopus ATCC 62051]|nr:hypothetical protein K438DRAFT_1834886 [Mycena galopus ATCC 62051]